MNIFTSKPGQSWRSKNVPIVLIAYILIAVIATAQDIFGGLKTFLPEGPAYLRYNNFRIFKLSFYHLVQGKDIYQLFPAEHWDLYKYSPAFALCFGILSWMPDSIGLLLWNLINSLCLFFGIRLLPNLSDERKSWILLFSLLEMLLSIQNTQSNGLMAGLIVLAFAFAERSKYAWSTLCIVFSFYIKIYGILALVFYLFYPGKLRLAAWTIFWMVFFALLPLAAVSTHQLGFLYNSWLSLLLNDRSASIGVSLMGIMDTWFHLSSLKNVVTVAGVVLFVLPLVHIRQYKDYTFRLLYLASVLIWMVIFNHKAESPTFVIVTAGIGIWYFSQRRDRVNLILLIVSFFLISMSVSDLVPAPVRNDFVRPYSIKAVMGIVIWFKILYEQLTLRYRPLGVADPSGATLAKKHIREYMKRLEAPTIQLLRMHFSFFLMPVYWFALGQVVHRDWSRALLIFVILHVLVYPASNGYNSLMDRDTTPIGGLREPLQPTRQLFWVTLGMDVLALVLGALIGVYFVAGLALYILASRAYSYRGIRLKKYPIIGFITVVSCQGALVFFMVYQGCHVAAAIQESLQAPAEAMIACSLLLGGFYPLTQIYQHEADRKDGVRTLSLLLGYRGTFVFTGVVYTIAFMLLAHYFLLTLQIREFQVLATCMLPVVVYFLIWAVKVWKDPREASYSNTMRMNLIASACTNAGFIAVLVMGAV